VKARQVDPRFRHQRCQPGNEVGYRSNRDDDWVKRGNAVSFYASDVNNLTFEIRYRVNDVTTPAPRSDDPKPTPAKVDSCKLDCDGDGVANGLDHCPSTRPGSRVDRRGCPAAAAVVKPVAPVIESTMQNPARRSGNGDADRDAVPDGKDLCPGTAAGAHVDRAGCAFDTDKDGVPEGVDQCVSSDEGGDVDARGCP
jgi:hypothetical protein